MSRASDKDRRNDLQEANRYREFMPDKSSDPEHRTRAFKIRKERRMWGAQFELLRRAWV